MPVSVTIVVHNAAPWLDEAIGSVRRQDYPDFELIIVDDSSTDRSPDIIDSHQKDDSRLRWFQLKERQGQSIARNLAVEHARHDLLAVLDGDDIALPGRLSRQVEIFRQRSWSGAPIGALGARARLIDSNGRFISSSRRRRALNTTEVNARLERSNCIIHSTLMMTREAFLQSGRYRPEFTFSQDYDLYLRMKQEFSIEVLGDVLVYHRVHDKAASADFARRQILDALLARACFVAREKGLAEPTKNVGDAALVELLDLPNGLDFFVAKELARRSRALAKAGARQASAQLRKQALSEMKTASPYVPLADRARILWRLLTSFFWVNVRVFRRGHL